MSEMQIVKLKNGATLIYQHQNLNNTTQAVIGFKTGSRCDGEFKGMTHLMEHLWFSGNNKYSDEEMFRFTKNTNTVHGACTSYNFVQTSLDCVTDNFDKMLEYNTEAILNRDYTKERIEQEIEVISEEILLTHTNATTLDSALGLINKEYNSPDIVGTKEILLQITPEMIKEYADNLFIAENLIASVVTNLSLEEVVEKFNASKIAELPSIKENEVPFYIPSPYKNNDSYFLTYGYGIENISLNILVTAKYINSLEYLPEIDLDILRQFENTKFNSFSGKLYKKTRLDKQLAYSSHYTYTNCPDTLVTIFNVETSPSKLNECILTVADIIRESRVEGITQQDFEDVIQIYKANLARQYNKNIDCGDASFNAEMVLRNEFVYKPDEVIDRLNAMGIEYYDRLFKEIYNQDTIMYCVTGDFEVNKLPSITQVKDWAYNDNPTRSLISYQTILEDENSKEYLSELINYYKLVQDSTTEQVKPKLKDRILNKLKRRDKLQSQEIEYSQER